MTQYVNFYTQGFRKSKVSFSFIQSMRMIFVLFLGLLAYGGWSELQINKVKIEAQQLQENIIVNNQKSGGQTLIEKLVERKTIINNQINQLQEDIAKKKVIAHVYRSNNNIPRSSFYGIFSEVANNADENLAITDIKIYDSGAEILVDGLARYKNEIPGYVERMRESNLLAQSKFGLLIIERLPESNLYRFYMERNRE